MKLIIAGSRGLTDYEFVDHTMDLVMAMSRPLTEVVCGMATGADLLGRLWAQRNDIAVAEFPADWSLGRGAGFLRNRKMAEYADEAVVFWDGKSRGSQDMINVMRQIGKPVLVVTYEENE